MNNKGLFTHNVLNRCPLVPSLLNVLNVLFLLLPEQWRKDGCITPSAHYLHRHNAKLYWW